MKKIQLVTYNPNAFNDYKEKIQVSNFNNLKSLDNFDINIFDLNSKDMWWNKSQTENNPSKITVMSSDYKSINQMIINSKKTTNIICLPQNIKYSYKYYDEFHYVQLKDMISLFTEIINQIFTVESIEIVYENSDTKIKDNNINASFYINNTSFEKLTRSEKSEKVTTIKVGNVIITTLDIFNNENINNMYDFLNEIKLLDIDKDYPDWLYKYEFNDDEVQQNKIEQAKEQIKIQKEIIEKANIKLQENLHYKSILCTNSDELVEVVFEILEYIFDISLSDFNDEKKEDFLFKKDDITYIGEIKGVTSNVKYEHVSQLEVHYSKYLDKLEEEKIEEKIKKILVMNYERTKDISVRDEINEMQIKLAKKNETLIIDTKTLLSIYEKILKDELSKEKVVKYLRENSGLCELDKINKE